MATDAHAFLQYREQDGDSWYLMAREVNIDRDYLLFALLADVGTHRFDTESRLLIADHCLKPKGLPEDWERSLERPAEEDDDFRGWVRNWVHGDGHSFTWLTHEELVRAANVYFLVTTRINNGIDDRIPILEDRGMVPRDLEAIIRFMGAYRRRGCAVRLVLWFDN